jgi:hypothetical protein
MDIRDDQMNKTAAIFSILLSMNLHAGQNLTTINNDAHPVIGVWRLNFADTSCYEEYDFRADGRLYTSSNQQQIESSYIIEREPSASGFYKLEEHILKENGGKDCLDMSQNEDTDYVYYLKFSPSEDQFLICLDESDEECIGYFIRQSNPVQPKLQQISATTM